MKTDSPYNALITPLPWSHSPTFDNRATIWSHSCLLGDIIGVSDEQAEANAQFIVESVNQSASLKARVQTLEKALEEAVGRLHKCTPMADEWLQISPESVAKNRLVIRQSRQALSS